MLARIVPTLVALAAMVAAAGAPATEAGPARSDAPRPLAGLRVSIDPGHNPGNAAHASRINRIVQRGPIRKACDTAGASTNGGVPEWRITGQLATRVARRLRALGATVTFTRANGKPAWGPCISGRADHGNRADVAVSIHADGAPSSGRGFHVIRPGYVKGWTGDITRSSRDLAVLVRDRLRGIRGGIPVSTYAGRGGIDVRTDLGGLTLSDVPKVMVEHGNLRNARDARLLTDARQQERIAAAVATAIRQWRTRR